MYQLIESIRIENRVPHLLEYHNRRFNEACEALFNVNQNFDLSRYIELPEDITHSRYKYRILFDGNRFEKSIQKYTQREIRSLRVVQFDDIDYSYKTTDREKLNAAFAKRENCDDVIIVKNGRLTDGFVSNILLFDGENWFTPDTPLLKGTQRAFLLDRKMISEKRISVDEIYNYTHIKLINAMVPIEKADIINIQKDVYGVKTFFSE